MIAKRSVGFTVLVGITLALLVYTFGNVLTGGAVVTSFDVDLAVGESTVMFGQDVMYLGQKDAGALVRINGFSKIVPLENSVAFSDVMVSWRPLRQGDVRLTISPREVETDVLSPVTQYQYDLSMFPAPFLAQRYIAGADVWRSEKLLIVLGEDATTQDVAVAERLSRYLAGLAGIDSIKIMTERGSQDVPRDVRGNSHLIFVGHPDRHQLMAEVVRSEEILSGKGYLRLIPSTEYALLIVSGDSDLSISRAADALISDASLFGTQVYV